MNDSGSDGCQYDEHPDDQQRTEAESFWPRRDERVALLRRQAVAVCAQFVREIARRRIAVFEILRQEAVDDPAERRRRTRIDLYDRLGIVVQDGRERVD